METSKLKRTNTLTTNNTSSHSQPNVFKVHIVFIRKNAGEDTQRI